MGEWMLSSMGDDGCSPGISWRWVGAAALIAGFGLGGFFVGGLIRLG